MPEPVQPDRNDAVTTTSAAGIASDQAPPSSVRVPELAAKPSSAAPDGGVAERPSGTVSPSPA